MSKVKRVPLAERSSLSFTEAMALTGLGRDNAKRKLENGDWRWYWEGLRIRIVTASIFEDQDRRAATGL